MGSKLQFGATTRKNRDDASGPSHRAALAVSRDDPPDWQPLFSRSNTIAQRRHGVLQRFNQLRKTKSAAVAARLVGSSTPSLWRWQKRFAARGLAGLRPRNYKAGRPSPFAGIHLSAQAVREIEMFHVEQPRNHRAAWLKFAGRSAACPPTIATYVQRTGRAPEPFAGLGRIRPVQARAYVSTDGRRLFVKLPSKGTLTAALAVPQQFKLAKLKP